MRDEQRLMILIVVAGLVAPLVGCGRQSEARPLTEAASVSVEAPALEPRASAPGATSSQPVVAALTQPVPPATQPAPKLLPDDKAGKLVGELLAPHDPLAASGASAPQGLSGPAAIEKPVVTPPRFQGAPPRLGIKPAAKLLPHAPPEGMPLAYQHARPQAPAAVKLAAGSLVQWPASDSSSPAEVPILSPTPLPDRAAFADPTVDSSAAAALEASLPNRTAPAPFVRINLPDPFEHRAAVRLQNPPPEDANPVTR